MSLGLQPTDALMNQGVRGLLGCFANTCAAPCGPLAAEAGVSLTDSGSGDASSGDAGSGDAGPADAATGG
jgi:hypothetical protein